ncbi:MAG TPA: signal peptidase I [Anaerohalosphaeraceae bacterium]|nr:signal peptidase I [Anaerohalosphaeraceae bacterium]HRT51382.1 signal peptidase I [Anaerohalosphaeraceae bacterium]HRT87303.1 signal peptidase I [Anaerohalosphaeraceae bacterium]
MTSRHGKQAKGASGVHAFVATFEWLIVAFATTLVFIVFEMQAYTIPTGSMAETLKGAHFRLRCQQCGYRFDYDFIPQHYRDYFIGSVPRNVYIGNNVPVRPPGPACPSCGFRQQFLSERFPIIKGDRIFVLKCVYQFFEPRRWDVVVFKNPLDPHENYIKRLIALPHETVEIIDGDVYVNGSIQRKPPRVQDELWMPVYDNDFQPANPKAGGFKNGVWRQPFINQPGSNWDLTADGPTVFSLDVPQDQMHALVYDTRNGNDFRATYAYDDPRYYARMPICSDLMVRFDVERSDAPASVGVALTKYGIEYRGWVQDGRTLRIEKVHANGLVEELARRTLEESEVTPAAYFQFANVDHMLRLAYAGRQLEVDLGAGPEDAGKPNEEMPRLALLGSGKFKLYHVGVFRDIHYITISAADGSPILRAGEGKPFTLGEDEFFVLGDNSPASLDARWWDAPGLGNEGRPYTMGTVPRDYLVGKAFFVYWPGPYRPFNNSALARFLERNRNIRFLKIFLNIPAVDGIKIIDGGAS